MKSANDEYYRLCNGCGMDAEIDLFERLERDSYFGMLPTDEHYYRTVCCNDDWQLFAMNDEQEAMEN